MIYIIFSRALDDIHEHSIPIGWVDSNKTHMIHLMTELEIKYPNKYIYFDTLKELTLTT